MKKSLYFLVVIVFVGILLFTKFINPGWGPTEKMTANWQGDTCEITLQSKGKEYKVVGIPVILPIGGLACADANSKTWLILVDIAVPGSTYSPPSATYKIVSFYSFGLRPIPQTATFNSVAFSGKPTYPKREKSAVSGSLEIRQWPKNTGEKTPLDVTLTAEVRDMLGLGL